MVKHSLPTTIAAHIFDDLRRRIIEGEFAAGQALREEDLRVTYGSSRGPIRESLRLLLQTGLVEQQPRRGFRVRQYTASDVRQIYRLRAMLEMQLISELSTRPLGPLLETLEQNCAVMHACFERSDLDAYFSENARFHQAIIDYAENRILLEVLEFVNEVSQPIRYRLLGDALPSRRSLNYHEQLVDLLRRGEIEQAKALVESQILENLERAVEVFANAADAETEA
ncbi:MAG: GntR family transcriptional regulator [Pseudomonadota bacterium]